MPPKYKELDFNSITHKAFQLKASTYSYRREFRSNYRTVGNFTYIVFNALIKASGFEENARFKCDIDFVYYLYYR